MIRKGRIFLCHNSREKETAKTLAVDMLSTVGLRSWIDTWEIPGGQDWEKHIRSAFVSSSSCLILLGGAGFGPYQRIEIEWAKARQAIDSDYRVIPILFPSVSETERAALEELLPKIHWIDLRGGWAAPDALQPIWNALKGDGPGPPLQVRKVAVAAEDWDRLGRSEKSILIRGAELQKAQSLAQHPSHPFDELSLEFLAASAAEQQRKTRFALVGLIALLMALTGGALIVNSERQKAQDAAKQRQVALEAERKSADAAKLERDRANHQRDIANVRQLAAQSRAVEHQERSSGVLLAAESVIAARGIDGRPSEAENALRFVLSGIGGTGLAEFGSRAGSGDVQISNDGKWVAIAGVDRTLHCLPVSVWNFQGNPQPAYIVLEGTQQDCNKPLLSPDGRWLLTFNNRNARSTLWRLSSHGLMARPTNTNLQGNVYSGEFSSDSKWLLLLQTFGKMFKESEPRLRCFDMSENEPRDVPHGLSHMSGTTLTINSAHGLVAVSIDGRGSDPDTGSDRSTLSDGLDSTFGFLPSTQHFDQQQPRSSVTVMGLPGKNFQAVMPGHALGSVYRLAFSGTGRYLAAATKDEITVWSMDVIDPRRSQVIIQKRLKRPLDAPWLCKLLFSSDEKWLVLTSEFSEHSSPAQLIELTRPFDLVEIGWIDSRASFSADSQWLALARLDRAHVWSLPSLSNPTAEALQGASLEEARRAAVFGTQSGRLITGGPEGDLLVWRYDRYGHWVNSEALRGHDREVEELFASADGSRIVSADNRGGYRTWDMKDLQPAVDPRIMNFPYTFAYHGGIVERIEGLAYHGGRLQRIDLRNSTSAEIDQAIEHSSEVAEIHQQHLSDVVNGSGGTFELSPDGKWSITENAAANSYAPSQPTYLNSVLSGHHDAPLVLCDRNARRMNLFSPDSTGIITVCGAILSVRNLKAGLNGAESHTLLTDFETEQLAHSPQGDWLVAGGRKLGQNLCIAWNRRVEDWWEKPQRFKCDDLSPSNFEWKLSFSEDGSLLMLSAKDRHLIVSLRGRVTILGPVLRANSVALSSSGHWLAYSADSSSNQSNRISVYLRDLRTGAPLRELTTIQGDAKSSVGLSFSPSEQWLVVSSPKGVFNGIDKEVTWDETVTLWDLKSATLHGYPLSVPSSGASWTGWKVLFTKDSQRLAIAREEAAEHIGVWDLQDRTMNPTMLSVAPDQNRHGVVDFAFSPDGQLFAAISDKATLWRLAAEHTAPSAIDLPYDFASSRYIALQTEAAASYTPGVTAGNSIFFSSDGERLIMLWGQLAVVWRTRVEELLVGAEFAVGRNMRSGEWETYMAGTPYRKTFEKAPIDESVVEKLLDEIVAPNGSTEHQTARQYRILSDWAVTSRNSRLCNRVAWRGALDGHASEVLPAADCAVSLGPYIALHWETRAVVRGSLGDTAGAANDILQFLKLTNSRSVGYTTTRKRWLATLQVGRNPFDAQTLSALADGR
ncbi:MAG TPA: toll/interleukin-1 receptor domain-containing protein [Terriglobales bacterium]|nr:toll/interleukin-1 receptor domain-containing protein [Terriglobales bacterium]